ncbi:MAG: Gfo/Idh/MocA family oxidoreductase [Treponema sp.]|jgi:predicted dehydrogenase|nr:Gfo/Idh/MocA family oxidoreductase [Treponema sp.]
MAKLRTAIIGCGRISTVYKRAFEDLADLAEPVFAVDKAAERARGFAASFGAAYSDRLEDLLAAKPDLVHICTPHFLHKEQSVACLEAGINVLCEKPIAITLADADAMIETAKQTGKNLGIIFQNRYIRGMVELKKFIEAGGLGKLKGAFSTLNWHRPPSYYQCDWKGSWEKEGGGVLIDQAIHSIDLVRYLVDSPVKSINGHIDTRVLTSIEVEDCASAAIEFHNGVIYSLFACNYYQKNAAIQIEIAGEKGTAHFDGSTVTINTGDEERVIPPEAFPENPGESYWGNAHAIQIKTCYEDCLACSPFPVAPGEARATLALVMGVYESSRQGRKVSL